MRLGTTTIGADRLTLAAGRVYLFDLGLGDLADDLVVGSLIARLDGGGGGSGEQALRPVVMEAGNLETFALGDEVVVAEGQTARWAHLTFDMPPILRAARGMLVGVAAGPSSGVARLAVEAGAGVSLVLECPYGSRPVEL